jgi:hypothetical protein
MRTMATLTALVGVLIVLSVVVRADAAPIDKSGLDILCKCPGCVYFPPTNSDHHSYCLYPDGSVLTCDTDKGTCSASRDANIPGGAGGLRFELNTILANQQIVLGTLNSLKASVDALKTDLANVVKEIDGLQLACAAPDLVPLQPRCEGETTLHLPVYNQGAGAAGPSSTLVTFRTPSGDKDVFVPTDALAGFTATELAVAIPAGCFDAGGSCKFQISVDAKAGSVIGAVAESNEGNNFIPLAECSRAIVR